VVVAAENAERCILERRNSAIKEAATLPLSDLMPVVEIAFPALMSNSGTSGSVQRLPFASRNIVSVPRTLELRNSTLLKGLAHIAKQFPHSGPSYVRAELGKHQFQIFTPRDELHLLKLVK
jgi:hypothetical protein